MEDSHFLVTGEDTFYGHIFVTADFKRRRHRPLWTREAKKTLHPVIMTCGLGHELINVEYCRRGNIPSTRHYDPKKGYLFFRWASRAYQGYEDTIYYDYYVLQQFRYFVFVKRIVRFFRKSKFRNWNSESRWSRNSRFCVTKATRQYTQRYFTLENIKSLSVRAGQFLLQ